MKNAFRSLLSHLCLWTLAFFSLTPAHAASDVFFTETFDNSATFATTWSGIPIVTVAHGTGSALEVDDGTTISTRELEAVVTSTNSLAGRRVMVSGQVMGTNIAGTTNPIGKGDGARVVFKYTMTDGTITYSNQAAIPAGSFNWMNFSFWISVPTNVAAVSLQIGMCAASGTAYFDELKVEADPVAFTEQFTSTASVASRWSGASYTVANGAVTLTNASGAGSSTLLSTTLPVAAYNGHRLLLTGQVKTSSLPSGGLSGVVMMITYTTIDGQTLSCPATVASGLDTSAWVAPTNVPANWTASDWNPPTAVSQSYWAHAYAVAVLPSNVTAVTLSLGLQNVAGSVSFENVQIQTNPMLYSEYFDDAQVGSRWSGQGTRYTLVAHGTGQAMEITNTASATTDMLVNLPVASFRGQTITLQASVKATNLSSGGAKTASTNGAVVQLKYQNSDGTYSYPQVVIPNGTNSDGTVQVETFDWTKFSKQITLPPDIIGIQLILGLQSETGTVDIDDVMIKGDSFPSYWVNPTPNYTGHATPRLRGTMVNSVSMTSTDLNVLGSWHANLARWPLGGTNRTYEDGLNLATETPNYNTVLGSECDKLDALLPTFSAQAMAVTLDLHALSNHLFDSAANQLEIINAWRTLAARYGTNGTSPFHGAVWGFDIANEPNDALWTDNLLTLNELSEQIALNIRDIDQTKAVVIESEAGLITTVPNLRPARTTNVVYSIHDYDPDAYVFQGRSSTAPYTSVGYTGYIGVAHVWWDIDQMRIDVQPAITFQSQYQTSIYVGEFSVARWSPGASQFLSDWVTVFEENNWDWSYHCFREADIWDLEISDSAPRNPGTPNARSTTPTDRQMVIMNAFAPNQAAP